jgi:hypothetical protein
VTLVWFALLIGLLITVHELGHFVMARLFGVRVLKLSIGFGRPLLRFLRHGTEYAVGVVPLGGYVRLYGENDPSPVTAADAAAVPADSFGGRPAWQRLCIIFAGPLANVCFAAFVFTQLATAEAGAPTATIGTVFAGQPAADADLRVGDQIVAGDGDDVRTWDELNQRVLRAPGRELRVTIERPQIGDDQHARAARMHQRIELARGRHRPPVDRGHDVEGAQAGLVGGRVLTDDADLRQLEVRRHADEPDALAPAERIGAHVHARRDDLGERARRFALRGAALDGDAHLAPGRGGDARVEVVPRAHVLAVDGDDAIAGAEVGVGRRLPGEDGPDGRRGRARFGAGELHEDERGEGDVGERPAADDAQPLPRRAQRERVGLLLGVDARARLLAAQAHVAAERDGADRVLGAAPLEVQERPSEADGELVDAHAEEARHREVTELVHRDEHADQQREPDERHIDGCPARSTTMAA